MINEKGYWQAKQRIVMLEDQYAHEACKASNPLKARNLWGLCDGMKICLKILQECVEQGTEQDGASMGEAEARSTDS